MKTDILIIGAGPAGIFTALELIRKGYKGHITLVEKGQSVEKRHCPKAETGRCMNCKPYCHITTGFSGAGAFSDGKLSLSHEVGGDLPTLVGERLAQETIDYADSIYLEFGADTHIEGISDPDKVKDIRRRAIQAGLKLVDCPIRHMGTEKAQGIYLAIERYLAENGVELIFGWECLDLRLKDETCLGGVISNGKEEREIEAGRTIVATGRRGADWLETLCAEHGIATSPAPWISVCASRCAMRSWRPSTRCSMSPSSSAIPRRSKTRSARSARIPAALFRRRITTTVSPS